MKKTLIYMFLGAAFITLNSCSEHELSYDNSVVDGSSKAQLRVMYDIAETSNTSLAIAKFVFNGSLVSLNSTSLGSGFPGTAGVYQMLPAGSVRMELSRSGDVKIYDQTANLSAGMQTAFVYDLNQAPMIIQDEPFLAPPDPWLDTCVYINFVNLLYKDDKTTPMGSMTLQLRRDTSSVKGTIKYEDINIATVDYKGSSGWIKCQLKRNRDTNRKLVGIWSGAETGLILRLVQGANVIFQNATSPTATGTASLSKGRYYYIHANGNGPATSAASNKRLGVWNVK